MKYSVSFLRRDGDVIDLVSVDIEERSAARELVELFDRADTDDLSRHPPFSSDRR